jgi:hypothetical protein
MNIVEFLDSYVHVAADALGKPDGTPFSFQFTNIFIRLASPYVLSLYRISFRLDNENICERHHSPSSFRDHFGSANSSLYV